MDNPFKITRQSNNSINQGPEMYLSSFGLFNRCTLGKYSDGYVWMVIKPILDGLKNVTYKIRDERVGIMSQKDISKINAAIDFVERNKALLWWQKLRMGFYCIDTMNGKFKVTTASDIRYDRNRAVVEDGGKIVLYGEKYQLTGKSDFDIIKENLRTIDVFKDGDINLTASGGALGILSGKGMPMNQADKEEFQSKLKNAFGIEGRKNQILISNAELDFKQMDLNVRNLQLMEKIREEIKFLCGYFNVPYDLVPFSGQSTYANQETAIRTFYRNCITSIAEDMLSIIRWTIKMDQTLIQPSDSVTFFIENVPELEDDRTAKLEYDTKLVEFIIKMKEAGLDTYEYEKQLKTNTKRYE